jgi:cysteine-rich repeat protein
MWNHRRAFLIVAAVGVAGPLGCHHTFIELNPDAPREADGGPDGGDVGGEADAVEGEAEADAESADASGDEASDADGGTVLPPPPCGNGVVDDGEECDDGNRQDADGCTWDCLLGDGNPPGPRDPLARAYRVAGPPVVLPVPEPASGGAPDGVGLSTLADGTIAVSWHRPGAPGGPSAALWSRFLLADGSLAREDVGIGLATGWWVSWLARTAAGPDLLLAWRAGVDGIWRSRVTVAGGLVESPALLLMSPDSDLPALAARPGGFAFAWYEGTDTAPCRHDGAGPSRILLGRLGADGALDAGSAPIELEAGLGARTPPGMAAGADGTVGLLWWRAGTEPGSRCGLRFGVADGDIELVADGGVVGPGTSGRIVDAEDAYRAVWYLSSGVAPQRLEFAAFDRGAMLVDAPTRCELPFEAFLGDVELAAGDHGLVAALRGWNVADGRHLYFVRTDLMGRTGSALCDAVDVDPSCSEALGCEPGPFGVTWAGDAFVVVYFVTLPGGPSPATELRMVRLVPAP